jgi:hypothetical protein
MLKLLESHYVPDVEVKEFANRNHSKSRINRPIKIKQREPEKVLNLDCSILGEKALWQAVITQALMDAGSKSKKMEAKFNRAQAIAWFSKRNPDFQLVCALADRDVDYVFERAHAAIRKDCKWRKNPNENQTNKR